MISDEDLKRAAPEATQTIDISDFVDLEESPPLLRQALLSRPRQEGGRVLRPAAGDPAPHRKVGIAKVVIRTRQYLAAVVARGDVLTLELMRYAHELRDPSELDCPRGKQGVTDREVDMAERLVEGMVAAWDPEKYKDTYRQELMKMIEKRVEAGQLESSPEPAPEAEGGRAATWWT